MTIHWCGVGLSSIPGLRSLIEAEQDVIVWNRNIAKAQEAIGDLNPTINCFDLDKLTELLKAGDVLVSMLPGTWHVELAKKAIASKANFVSSSYISPEMAALDGSAREAGVRLVNEVGLDPGIDHLMAHNLVSEYRKSEAYRGDNILHFNSYCGGVPKYPNSFRYKFSWAPEGVLKALKSPARFIHNFKPVDVEHPWSAIEDYKPLLEQSETFEVYPNRDSIPFMEQYRFLPDWKISTFVRGTLRLEGWKEAWHKILPSLSTMDEKSLTKMANDLMAEHAYEKDEPDRVILCVELKAEQADGKAVWHHSWLIDAFGDNRGSAMGRLVSFPITYAIEAVESDLIKPGVSAAPKNEKIVNQWLDRIQSLSQIMYRANHLNNSKELNIISKIPESDALRGGFNDSNKK